ncbi:MAG: hypothetical protein ACRER1_04405 [Gammaproteobacteria bacterium]
MAMNRIFAVLAIAGFCFCQSAVAHASSFSILSPIKGPALLQQCSRPTPRYVDSYWQPANADVAELERRLVIFLKENSFGKRVFPLSAYHRQYVGFIKGGKRYIYGNFYTTAINRKLSTAAPVIVCDGGKDFWGIVYSMESKKLQDAVTNGPA